MRLLAVLILTLFIAIPVSVVADIPPPASETADLLPYYSLEQGWNVYCNQVGAEVRMNGYYVGVIPEDHRIFVPFVWNQESTYCIEVISHGGEAHEWRYVHEPWADNDEVVYFWLRGLDDEGAYSMAVINSNPDGAKVYLQDDYLHDGDYKYVGKTNNNNNLELFLHQGKYRIVLYYYGKDLYRDTIRVSGTDSTKDTGEEIARWDYYYVLQDGISPDDPDHWLINTPTPTPIPTPTQEPTPSPTSAVIIDVPAQKSNTGQIFVVIILIVAAIAGAIKLKDKFLPSENDKKKKSKLDAQRELLDEYSPEDFISRR